MGGGGGGQVERDAGACQNARLGWSPDGKACPYLECGELYYDEWVESVLALIRCNSDDYKERGK